MWKNITILVGITILVNKNIISFELNMCHYFRNKYKVYGNKIQDSLKITKKMLNIRQFGGVMSLKYLQQNTPNLIKYLNWFPSF